jgi:hypothetical protein
MPSTATPAGFALLMTLPFCGFAATIAKPPDSAAVSGTIVEDSGRPAEGATVFVYSARLKKGYAVVCPTCWIDCGKRADTDAQGRFTITGLNPALKFRLLVVKDGFTATAKGGVDPARGPLPPIKLIPRDPSVDESMIVHGRVTDTAGNPVADALIEPVEGIQTEPGGHAYFGAGIGAGSWSDPLAVTNASGEFAIVATKPVEKIVLKISPRALAAKLVTEVTGPATSAVVLTEGATVMGRLVEPNGTPTAHAEVVMIAHADSTGWTLDDMRVGTGKDGSFVFTNVPAGRIWGISPSPESLRGRNLAAGVRWCESTRDRQVVNIGNLTLRRGFTVSGKIQVPDQAMIPPGMHVTIKSEWTVNNRLADVAPDGAFELNALAPGIYNLWVGMNGYVPTPDSSQQLLVDHDRRNVIVHMARSP